MFLDFLSMEGVMILIGEITFVILIGLLIFGLIFGLITLLSMRRGRFYFPRLLKPAFVIAGSLIKGICKVLGLEDRDLNVFLIRLHNKMHLESFADTPADKRAVFLPQCLRSTECPSRLGPNGLVCQHCGRCGIDQGIRKLEKMGYKVYIVPGSTFIKRLIKQCKPGAILGVGCIMEVREGLEMADKIGLPAQGVVMLRDGCVSTAVDWADVLETAGIGVETSARSDGLST